MWRIIRKLAREASIFILLSFGATSIGATVYFHHDAVVRQREWIAQYTSTATEGSSDPSAEFGGHIISDKTPNASATQSPKKSVALGGPVRPQQDEVPLPPDAITGSVEPQQGEVPLPPDAIAGSVQPVVEPWYVESYHGVLKGFWFGLLFGFGVWFAYRWIRFAVQG